MTDAQTQLLKTTAETLEVYLMQRVAHVTRNAPPSLTVQMDELKMLLHLVEGLNASIRQFNPRHPQVHPTLEPR